MPHARATLLVVLVLASCSRSRDPLPTFPHVMLWAWERPEHLDFINPSRAGVAFLSETIQMDARGVRVRPRLQPLTVPPGTPLMAVVRLETSTPALPDAQQVAAAIVPVTRRPGVRALQIDFDARRSERGWYRNLLTDLRQSITRSTPITMTALASWCADSGWLRSLPVDDAVPMLFRMGTNEPYRQVAESWRGACESSIGVSTDELPARVSPGRRLYFFHPAAWTPEAYEGVLQQARRWQ